MKYLMNLLLGFDQLGNTIIGGSPDETISARTGRNIKKHGWRVLGWVLNHIQRGHTEEAVKHERDGSQQDPSYDDLYHPKEKP
jgi:hypothetical protein